MASHSQISLLQQRMQRPSPLLLRTPVVVGSQQAVATGTRSQAAVTLQLMPASSPQSAKAVEEVGSVLSLVPRLSFGKEPTLFVTNLLLLKIFSCLPCRQQAIHIK